MYGCAKAAAIMDQKMKNARPSVTQRKRPPAPEKPGIVMPLGVRDPREGD